MTAHFSCIATRIVKSLFLILMAVLILSCGGGEKPAETASQPTPLKAPALANPAPLPSMPDMEEMQPLSPEDILADLTPLEQAKTELNALGIALIAYRCHVGEYPNQEQGLNALLTPPADENLAQQWRGPYSDEILITDPWGNIYVYNWLDGPEILFTLTSLGPDGTESEDDISLSDLPRSAGFAQRAFVDDFIQMFESQADIFNK